MRRALCLVPVALTTALIAGCSSSSGGAAAPAATAGATQAAAPVTATPTPEPFAGDSAAQILGKAVAAAKKAESVHVKGAMKDGKDTIAIDMATSTAKGGAATGSITMNDDEITLRRIGKVIYFKAPKAFWTGQAGADKATAALLGGRWIKGATSQKDWSDFVDLTSVDGLSGGMLDLSKSEKASLKKVAGKEVDGKQTVGLYDKGGKDDEAGTLYVATDDPTLPLLLQSDSGQKIAFTDWNEPVSVSAPKDPLDLSKS